MMTLGSLFDGLGGWLLAARHAGVKPIWSSEIERFPCAVTAHHFPDVKQLGDIMSIDGAKIEPVDIITCGSPCQDLSVAGKQEGLKGERSGLFLRAVDIVRAMRRTTGGKYPRFFVWENVPGAFSSNWGLDFRTVLESLAEAVIPMPDSGKWAPSGVVRGHDREIAWRVLDAQYFGVPQRRKRIFLVTSFGARRAGEILLEPESVRGDSAAGGDAREGAPAGAESGAGKAVYIPDKARSLTARMDGSPCIDRGPEIIAASFKWRPGESARSLSYSEKTAPTLRTQDDAAVMIYDPTHADEVLREVSGDKSNTLNARMGTGGNQVPVIAFVANQRDEIRDLGDKAAALQAQPGMKQQTFCIAGNVIDRQIQNGGNGRGVNEEISFTLNTIDRHAVCVGNGQTNQGMGDKAGALNCMHDQQAVLVQAVRLNSIVRRLMPLECTRLQGLPDDYLDVEVDGKPASDTAKYKALGNGMAQPVADYVIRRIVEISGGA